MPTHKWSEIRDKVYADPERRARIEVGARQLRAEAAALAELRRARGFTQRQLGEAMNAPQPRIAQIEKQVDLYLSTLRSYVEAMGGRVEIRAVFPDAVVSIQSLGSLAEEDADAPERVSSDAAEGSGRELGRTG